MDKATAKAAFAKAVETMPDEAFSWLAMAARVSSKPGMANVRIWPDGIGGFMSESRTAIEAARAAADAYVDAAQG